MSYEVLNISAHKLSKPQLLPFFCENTAPLISDSEILDYHTFRHLNYIILFIIIIIFILLLILILSRETD